MEQITTIGLDIAKSVFQVHGIAADGAVVVRRQLRRAQVLPFFKKHPPCLVGIEACATAHHWAREIAALGHEVKLMPAKYVKAYVKRNKHDAADAEAICEAVTRPTMRFVPIKTPEQQALLMLHRTRKLLVRQRIRLVERHTRYVLLAKVADKRTQTVVSALIKQARKLPSELYKSLTWDRGKELTDHRRFSLATDIDVYFCDPRSPWQRGSNENTNRLLRQYFPKGTDLSAHSQAHLDKVARQLNERPRKTLGFETPADRFNACVAAIG